MASSPKPVRCAIYTRKSSEEGLEQEFNSLDAQREACESYVASQKAEGWLLLRDHYNDGGAAGTGSGIVCGGVIPVALATRTRAGLVRKLASIGMPGATSRCR